MDITEAPADPLVTYYNEYQESIPLCEGREVNFELLNYPDYPRGTIFLYEGPSGYQSYPHPYPAIDVVTHERNEGWYYVWAIARGCTSINSGAVYVPVIERPDRPVITQNGPLCVGETLTLTAEATGPHPPMRYLWSGPEGFFPDGQTVTRTMDLDLAGTYEVVARNSQGCLSRPARVDVEVVDLNNMALRIDANTPVCAGDPLLMEVNVVPGATYHWSGPNNFVYNESNSTRTWVRRDSVTTADAGRYELFATLRSCTSTKVWLDVEVRARPEAPVVETNAPLCTGQDLTLEVSNLASGGHLIWEGPNGFRRSNPDRRQSRFSVTDLDAGTYSVWQVVSGCTSAVTEVEVVVSDPPLRLFPQANLPVCTGDQLQLSVNSSPGVTYLWQGPNGFSAEGAQVSRTVSSQLDAGGYSVTAIVGNCTSTTSSIFVQIQPRPDKPEIQYGGAVCTGARLNLTASSANAFEYAWSGPGGFSSREAQISRRVLSVDEGGSYEVWGVALGCTSERARVDVVVNPTPQLEGVYTNSPLCVGDHLELTALSDVRPVTWHWSGPQGFSRRVGVSNTERVRVRETHAGMYRVYAEAEGCTSEVRELPVAIHPIPARPSVPREQQVCLNREVQLRASAVSGATYRWWGPNGFQSTEAEPTRAITQLSDGGYYSVAAIVNGCTSDVAIHTVDVLETPAAPKLSQSGPVCMGESVELMASHVPDGEVIWSGPAGFSARGQRVTRVIAEDRLAGVYTARAVVGQCTSAQAQVLVEVFSTSQQPDIQSNSPLCPGESLQLGTTLIPGADYFWTGPQGFTSRERQPVIHEAGPAQAGTYYLAVVQGSCTSEVASTVVRVIAPGQSPTITTNAPICSGQMLNLQASGAEGTYHWTGPNGFRFRGPNPAIRDVQPEAGGTYEVLVINEGCTTGVARREIMVQTAPSTPVISASQTALCSGQTLQLHAPAYPGTRYHWSGPNGFRSQVPQPVLEGLSPESGGVYTLELERDGCRSSVAQIRVEVVETPEVPRLRTNGPVCAGQPLYLTTDLVPGVSYLWTGPNAFRSTVPNPAIQSTSPANSGRYRLVVSRSYCRAEADLEVQVQDCGCEAPANIRAEALTPNRARFTWPPVTEATCYVLRYGELGADPTGWRSIVLPAAIQAFELGNLEAGTDYGYQIRTNCSGCSPVSGNLSEFTSVQSLTTPLGRFGEQQPEARFGVEVYPNPSSGSVEVALTGLTPGLGLMLEVVDVHGRVLYTDHLQPEHADQQTRLDLSGQPSGVYLLRVHQGELKQTVRLMID